MPKAQFPDHYLPHACHTSKRTIQSSLLDLKVMGDSCRMMFKILYLSSQSKNLKVKQEKVIESENIINSSVKIAVREDGFQVYIFTDLVEKISLERLNCEDIKVASIKGSFQHELLSEFSNLEMLTFTEVDMKNLALERLIKLAELKRLVLVDCTLPGKVNLGGFIKLEELDLNWSPAYSLNDNGTLKDLVLRKVNTRDLSFLNCEELETLEIIQGKLVSLYGIGKLKNLKALTLVGLKNLSELFQIGSLHNLEYLDLRGIRAKLNSHLIIDHLPGLKWLILENCDCSTTLESLLAHKSLRGVKILTRYKMTEIEKRIMSTFADTKYGYFRPDNVRDRLSSFFRDNEISSKN